MTNSKHHLPLITRSHPGFCVQLDNGIIKEFNRDFIISSLKEESIRLSNQVLLSLYNDYLIALKLVLENPNGVDNGICRRNQE